MDFHYNWKIIFQLKNLLFYLKVSTLLFIQLLDNAFMYILKKTCTAPKIK